MYRAWALAEGSTRSLAAHMSIAHSMSFFGVQRSGMCSLQCTRIPEMEW